MMRPDPSRRAADGGITQLLGDALLDQRPVPPRAHREQRVANGEVVTIAGNAELADLRDPARDLLALRVALVEVVIAGAENDAGPGREQRKVLLHHYDLGAKIHHRADVQRIA